MSQCHTKQDVFDEEELKWFEKRGCEWMKAEVPKGSVVIWDSRLFHATDKPLRGRPERKHRFIVFGGYKPRAIVAAAA